MEVAAGGGHRRWALPVVVTLVALPSLATLVTLLGRHWYAASDQAMIALRIDDVGTSHTPLVGLGSRARFAHPGPAMFWLLAPFRRVLGPTGVLAGVAVINVAVLTATVVVAHRRGGLRLAALLALVLVLVTNTSGATVLFDPWNPSMSFFPFALVVVLVWSVWCGDALLLVPAVVVGSIAVQSHVSYAPVALGLVLTAAVVVITAARRRDRRAIAALRWTAVAGVLVWVPPVVEQVAGDGNLARIFRFLRDPGEPAAGWGKAFGVLGVQLHPLGAWLTGDDVLPGGLARTRSPILAVGVVALVAAASLWGKRRGAADEARLGFVVLLMVALGLLATANVTGLFVPYLFRWWWLVAGIAVAAAVNGAVAAAGSEVVDRVVSTLAVAGLAGTVALVLAQVPPPMPFDHLSTAIGAVAGPTAAAVDDGGRYLVRGIDTSTFGAPVVGLQLELERRGVDVYADRTPGAEFGVGEWRLAEVDEVDGIVSIIAIDDHDAGSREPAGSELVAEFDPLTGEERDRLRALDAAIRRGMGDDAPEGQLDLLDRSTYQRALAAGVPREDVDELRRLQGRGDGVLVFLTRLDR